MAVNDFISQLQHMNNARAPSTGLFPLILFLFRQPFDHFDAKQTSYPKNERKKKGTFRLKQMTTTTIENLKADKE